MDPDTEILFTYPSLFRIYKSGRVERAPKTTTAIPASFDPATGVTSRDLTIDPDTGVTARLYLPSVDHSQKLPLLIYFHGGAFCVYSPSSPIYHSYANSLASRARLAVLSVGYRLAPENLLPAGYDDSWAAVNWALSDAWLAERCDYGRVFLAGDSAGGNIAHQMAMRIGGGGLGDMIRVEGMALVHPFFWGRDPVGRETRDARVREFIGEIWRVVNAPGVDADDPRINPTAGRRAPSLAGLGCGRAIVCVAEKDALVERGRAYFQALEASGWGGEVELVESRGEGHCFHLDDPQGAEALELMNRLVHFFNRVGRNQGKKVHHNGLCKPIPCSGLKSPLTNILTTKDKKEHCIRLNLENHCELLKWVDQNNTQKMNCCKELVVENGERQHVLTMDKVGMNAQLWMIGKKRIIGCLIGFLLGFVFILYRVMFDSL